MPILKPLTTAHPSAPARSERSRGRAVTGHRANRDLPVGSLLVTRGSGVVGSALLRELGDLRPLALVEDGTGGVPSGSHLHCDLAAPRFGLSHGEHRLLARRAGAIVHCTGDGVGTEQVLELCELAGAPLYLLSTAFDHRAPAQRAAERAVRRSGLPATIVRTSTVIGDSASGAIGEFGELHALAGALVGGRLPLLPLDANDVVDFVPQDVVAGALGRLVRSGATGGARWLTAGRRAVPVHRFVRACVALGSELGLAPRTPTLASRPLMESHAGGLGEVLELTRRLAVVTPLPSSLSTLPDLELALDATLRHWATRNGLAAMVRP